MLVFDDSFVHEVWNDSDELRVVLFLNRWHPCLSEPETRALSDLQKAYNSLPGGEAWRKSSAPSGPGYRRGADVSLEKPAFPLPLTALEELLLYGERPDYPMCFTGRCRFIGRLDEAAFDQALRKVQGRHPLLLARVDQGPGGLVWNPVSGSGLSLSGSGQAGTALDPRSGPGLRITLDSGEDSSLFIEFHHSYCDGEGANLFLRELFAAYHEQVSGEEVKWARLDFGPLSRRGELPGRFLDSGSDQSLSPGQRLRFLYDFLALFPERIRGDRRKPGARRREFSTLVLTPSESLALRKEIEIEGLSLNDLAIVLLFQTLNRWQARMGVQPGFRGLRLLIPTSLRSLSDRRAGAMNRISFAFLGRRRADCGNTTQLIRSVCRDTDFIKRFRPDLSTLLVFQLLRRWGVTGVIGWPLTFSSATLSYMGELAPPTGPFPLEGSYRRVGDVHLESASFTPPISVTSRLAFGVCRVSDRLSLSLRADPSLFSTRAEQDLLALYGRAWREWGSRSPRGIHGSERTPRDNG